MVAGIDGTRKNHTMMMPCMREQPIVFVGGQEQSGRADQFEPHQTDGDAADEEETVIDSA